jgi:DNA-binding GntR family transcriptional regulator
MARRSAAKLQIGMVEHETLHERIYRELRRALMSGAVRPGQSLSYRGLAEALGTSPMPVRDAVRRLISERALEALPNRTIAVPTLSTRNIDEIYKIRISLEGLAAEEAAGLVSDRLVGELETLEDQMEETLKAGDIRRFMDQNWRFHFKIYGAAEMPQLTEVIENFWLQIGPLVSQQAPQTHGDIIFAHHRSAVGALKRRDGPAARAAIAADLADARIALLEAMNRPKETVAPSRARRPRKTPAIAG